ncbi:MAG: DUF2934 domain-containing protein, partial [Burkholderiales bacterium]|nr:DUF2934 domain-containing protein [Burkholderiales bacterium]
MDTMNEKAHDDKSLAKGEPAAKPSQDELEKAAYALSQKDGRPKASAKENWLEAEAQLQHAGSGHAGHSDHQAHQGHEGHEGHQDHQ